MPTKVLSVYVNVNIVFFTLLLLSGKTDATMINLSFQIVPCVNKPFRSFEIGLISDRN